MIDLTKVRLVHLTINGLKVAFRPLKLKDHVLTFKTIERIAAFIREEVRDFPNVYIDFTSVKLSDKLPISMLELYLYKFLNRKSRRVFISYSFKSTIFTRSIRSSPLRYLGRERGIAHSEANFIQGFKFSTQRNPNKEGAHYRILLPANSDGVLLSRLNSDVSTLFPKYVQANTSDTVTQVITELAENAISHAEADCIVDLDITPNDYRQKNHGKEKYFGINVSIVNCSKKLLFTDVRNKISNNFAGIRRSRNWSRYDYVNSAYDLHKRFFDRNYTDDDFWVLAALQHKISGRQNDKGTGGTGLTTLVNTLQEASKLDKCYVLTGNVQMLFKKEYMIHNELNWLGFNESNNFFESPDKSIFVNNCLNFLGTAYNLSFIMKG